MSPKGVSIESLSASLQQGLSFDRHRGGQRAEQRASEPSVKEIGTREEEKAANRGSTKIQQLLLNFLFPREIRLASHRPPAPATLLSASASTLIPDL